MLDLSKLYFPTLKEDPQEAEIPSHKLLLRAGYIRKMGSGIYTFLPLGWTVLEKVKKIIREEIALTGTQEILMPILQPATLWHESGRWDDYGPEMMRLNDRHDNQFCLGPTHEELITSLVTNELKSYKQLPVSICQMQDKFRDELRPRFGLLRTREFLMHDTYSFHASQECLDEFYEVMGTAYGRICDRLGLEWVRVEADSGQIGGSVTAEFMGLADNGESDILFCDCDFAADAEAAKVGLELPTKPQGELEKIHTPGVGTIDELCEFIGVTQPETVKALCGTAEDGQIYAIFVPGDHELNDIKIEGLLAGFRFLDDEEMQKAGLPKGSIGPVGLPDGIKIIMDESLRNSEYMIVGANERDYHYKGACPGRDFNVDIWADLVLAKEGDLCPNCGKKLACKRGIEVSQIFQLGTKYSTAMNAMFMAEDNSEQPFIMGCYGIGVTRSMAAVIEQCNDENGIYWPMSIAPAHVVVLPLQSDDENVMQAAQKIASELESAGVEVAIDPRQIRPGVKFADADLVGWPYQIVIGKRGFENGVCEL
ncbi:MAG: proline--tRNA ligase, partial [Coriobacteriales bacterium]|nr:proline--tRNA ligase [Coriobacteriales bacterium]